VTDTTTLYLTPQESVHIREHSSDVLEVEGRWAPNASAPPKHFHPEQDEAFEVLEGVVRARIDGVERSFTAGESFAVPRGAVHQLWNPGAGACHLAHHPGGPHRAVVRGPGVPGRNGRLAGTARPGRLPD